MQLLSLLTVVGAFAAGSVAVKGPHAQSKRGGPKVQILPRQLPAEPTGVQTIISPVGANITYKEPGKEGVCETTPGVNSYAGFINLGEDVHSFFWFFESRNDPANDPITLWLNGGPGSDSLIGLFEELGPCNITEDLISELNPYSWTNASNMIFLSQPIGVGFSYGSKAPGSLDDFFGWYVNATSANVTGRYPIINATAIDTTDLAAIAAWEVIQGFYSALPQLDSKVQSTQFNLWTESYGGHYGPAFFNYFYQQNELIKNGTTTGKALDFVNLGIINGIIDEYIQAPYYPLFANNNTYGIKGVNDTVFNYMNFAAHMPNGCLDQVTYCYYADQSTLGGQSVCTEAANMCRDNVESPYYYAAGERGVYDIRHPFDDPTPPSYFVDYLNLDATREALGVDTNYTLSNNDIYYAFQQTGDFVYFNFIEDLEQLLNSSTVRVTLVYGDADYICNWFGGEAVSLGAQWTHTDEFNKAGYTPFTVDGVQYGETREYGNFSFTRIYEAGHEVPYYQPIASLEFFRRSITGLDIATGKIPINATYATTGDAETTHTESFVPLPATSSSASAASSSTGSSHAPLRFMARDSY